MINIIFGSLIGHTVIGLISTTDLLISELDPQSVRVATIKYFDSLLKVPLSVVLQSTQSTRGQFPPMSGPHFHIMCYVLLGFLVDSFLVFQTQNQDEGGGRNGRYLKSKEQESYSHTRIKCLGNIRSSPYFIVVTKCQELHIPVTFHLGHK